MTKTAGPWRDAHHFSRTRQAERAWPNLCSRSLSPPGRLVWCERFMKSWFRHAVRRCGIDVPSCPVVCPEQVTTILIGASWRARVTVQQTLVFLGAPESGDLRDALPIASDAALGGFVEGSPDANEIARRRRRGSLVLYWEPRERVIPYGLFAHQVSWNPSASYESSALCIECRCDKRTGILGLELVTPGTIETAIAFKRPRWQRMNSERSVVKYALRQLESPVMQPVISDDRRRVEFKVLGPKVGDRYVCVVFHQYGVNQWQERLRSTSIVGRVRSLIGRPVPVPT